MGLGHLCSGGQGDEQEKRQREQEVTARELENPGDLSCCQVKSGAWRGEGPSALSTVVP